MFNTAKKMAATAIASALVAASVLPAEAMPIVKAPAGDSSNVQTVQYHGGPNYRRYDGRGHGKRYNNGYNNHYHGHRPPPGPPPRRDYGWDGDNWVPLAILGAGALIIGGAVAAGNNAPRQVSGLNPKHYAWCEQRYRSYRPSDNSFQPYHGPREQCLSPYY